MAPATQESVGEYLDSHAHLTFDRFHDDLDAVLARARSAGVSGVVTVGSGGGVTAFRAARELASRYDRIWATAGVHPHDARYATEEVLRELAEAARSDDVVAIGEIGLDFHYDHSPRCDQKRVLAAQLALAREVAKPFVLHTREADEATLDVLRADGGGLAGVVHCFSGGPAFAEALLDLGLHVSFSGIVTFPSAEDVRRAAAIVPDQRLLIETDSPYLAPTPHRGRRNEPAFVVAVAHEVARIRGVSVDDVARITARNARLLFGLGASSVAPIVYPIRDRLYVNVTNRCTLSCVFCPKRRDWTVKGHLLRHDLEPSDEAVADALWSASPERYEEVVFCGLGEPTFRLDLIVALGESLRRMGARTRLDTDGLASLRYGRDVVHELARGFDAVSVSLNAADGETYCRLCPSEHGARAWDAVVAFVRGARSAFSDVTVSAVAVPGLDVEAVREWVERNIQVRFRVRAYNVVG